MTTGNDNLAAPVSGYSPDGSLSDDRLAGSFSKVGYQIQEIEASQNGQAVQRTINAIGESRPELNLPVLAEDGYIGPVSRQAVTAAASALGDDALNTELVAGREAYLAGSATEPGQQGFRHGWRQQARSFLEPAAMPLFSPYLGSFLQTDPAGTVNDKNVYSYVGNGSLNFTDPSGNIRQAAAQQGVANPGDQVNATKGNTIEDLPLPRMDQMVENIKEMRELRDLNYFARLVILYSKVQPGAEWDYKNPYTRPPPLEAQAFGNINYGAVGKALGIPEAVLLRAAG